MTVEQQAEKLIDEAYQYAPSSGGTKEAISIMIAIWCAEKIASNIGFSVNESISFKQLLTTSSKLT